MNGADRVWKPLARLFLGGLRPVVDRRDARSTALFSQPGLIKPRAGSRLWAWKHYGVFLPDLPQPWRYLNTMTFIGSTGARCFDNDAVVARDCRRNATVLSSTAHGQQHHYQAYDIDRDCDFSEDGSRLRWGDDLVITAEHPRYTVRGSYPGFSVSVSLTASGQASWFVDTPIYQHFSLRAPYEGEIVDEHGTTRISGTGTVEYARCVSPQSFSSRPLPWGLKIPVDFFTYQIVALPGGEQLLLTDVRALGSTACRLAQPRRADGAGEVFKDVAFSVVEWAGEAQVSPSGRRMRVPERMRWVVSPGVGEIEAVVDAPWRYGHGKGYVTAYRYTGVWRGKPVSGSGYCEWVDVEGWAG